MAAENEKKPAGPAAKAIAKVVKKLVKSTGRAAWVVGTSMLLLTLPLIIEMDRDNQYTEMEKQQMGVLQGPAGGAAAPAPASS